MNVLDQAALLGLPAISNVSPRECLRLYGNLPIAQQEAAVDVLEAYAELEEAETELDEAATGFPESGFLSPAISLLATRLVRARGDYREALKDAIDALQSAEREVLESAEYGRQKIEEVKARISAVQVAVEEGWQ